MNSIVSSAKLLLKHLVETRSTESPNDVAKTLGLIALPVDDVSLSQLCQSAIQSLPEEASAIRAGNLRVLNKLVGFVMKSSKGRANAAVVQETLKKILGK